MALASIESVATVLTTARLNAMLVEILVNGTDPSEVGEAFWRTVGSTAGAIDTAITTIATSRAKLGASQNRLEFASTNLATSIENTEAARSDLLDLDVAREMTNFTSKQILLQAGHHGRHRLEWSRPF